MNVAFYEKIVSTIQPIGTGMEATLESSKQWAGGLITLFPDLSVENSVSADLEVRIIDLVGVLTPDMDVAVAEAQQVSANLSANIIDNQLHIGMDVITAGASGDVPFFVPVPMDANIVDTNQLQVGMDVLIPGGFGFEVKARMDVAVLGVAPPINSITTPENSRYSDCRPLWCGVPKQKEMTIFLQANILGQASFVSLMDLWITSDEFAQGVDTIDLSSQPADPPNGIPTGKVFGALQVLIDGERTV